MTKQLSAVELALREEGVEGFRLTDDILIMPPSRKQAEAIQNADGSEKIMEILCGDDWPAAKEILENLPLAVEINVMQKMLVALSANLPTVDDVISRLGLEGADAEAIAKKVAESAAS